MVELYKTNLETNELEKIQNIEKGTWINMVHPTEKEIQYVCEQTLADKDLIRYALDQEERSRIDIEDDQILALIDVPIVEKIEDAEQVDVYNTIPLGMIVVRDDYFITVCLKDTPVLSSFEKGKIKDFYTYKKTRFILQVLHRNALYFLAYLKRINRETDKAELALQKSMRNKELISLLNIEKSLVYFTTSLKSNEIVMEKFMTGKILKLYEEDEDIIEDAIIENKQAIEMSKIYSDILSGMMDAYASVISNNLNIVMKILASVTIILSIPTLIASFFGMNVHVPFEGNAFAFWIIMVISFAISILTTLWLRKKDML